MIKSVAWMDSGACTGDQRFTALPQAVQKEVCSGCPVRTECLDYAVAGPVYHPREDDAAVFGGLTRQEIYAVQKSQPRPRRRVVRRPQQAEKRAA